MKMGVFLMIIPIVAWFIPDEATQLFFGIGPTFWPVKAFWMVANDSGDVAYLGYLLVGTVYHLILILLMSVKFNSEMKK